MQKALLRAKLLHSHRKFPSFSLQFVILHVEGQICGLQFVILYVEGQFCGLQFVILYVEGQFCGTSEAPAVERGRIKLLPFQLHIVQ